MLYIIGTGLNGPRSITVEALEVVRGCSLVYLDTYTSFQSGFSIQDFEKTYEKEIRPAERSFLEADMPILDAASEMNVALLVVGDPLMATTHNMLRKIAKERGIETKIYGNSSIVNSFPSRAGLSPYRMAPPVSIPFPSERFTPVSPYRKIMKNMEDGLHTLLLLDLKDGKTMPPADLYSTLFEMRKRLEDSCIEDDSLIIAGSCIGSDREWIAVTRMKHLVTMEERSPMSFIIPANLTEDEDRFVKTFCKSYP